MSNMKNIFGVEADDKSLQTKKGGVFGLNTGNISKLEFVEETSEENSYKAVDLVTKIGDREYFNRFFLNDRVYNKNNELIGPGDENYEDEYYNHYSQIVAVIKHALGALGVSKETINSALAGVTSDQLFEGMKRMTGLVPSGFQNIPVDIFLEYQWNIPAGQDRTFLTLPKNMKGGEFLCASMTPQGSWTEVRGSAGLHYVDDAGNKHLFQRSETYMESNKAIQQGVNDSPEVSPQQASQRSSWT